MSPLTGSQYEIASGDTWLSPPNWAPGCANCAIAAGR
jgi:hypothetical protein